MRNFDLIMWQPGAGKPGRSEVKTAEKEAQLLLGTGMVFEWCRFEKGQFIQWLGMAWLHFDRWSAAYGWVHDGCFPGRVIPGDIVACLVAYWESHTAFERGM